jgi:hypothetical protein
MKGDTVLALHPSKKLRTEYKTGILVVFTVNNMDVAHKELKKKT